ncbi:hypothetical protein P4V47_01395 [Brevibacillus laterosporus]|uniref:hypothetical protein n=1 Tax=Brevibacillus laterosporus TaxID=1465 RepID=UPI002E1ED524|nr:hypothetical protein [Brevibacillus laterosporus]
MEMVREKMVFSLPKESYNLFVISRKKGEWQVNKRMYTFGTDISKTHSKLVPRGIPYSQAPYVTIKKENIFEAFPAAIMECFARNKTVN